MKIVIPLFNLLLICSSLFFTQSVHAVDTKVYQITEAKEFVGTPYLPSVLWYTRVNVPWKSGRVVVARNPDGTGTSDVGFQFEVYGSDTSKKFVYTAGCGETPMAPLDITHLMGPRYSSLGGNTELLIRYNRLFCNNWKPVNGVLSAYVDVSPLYVVHFDDTEGKVTPFLELPWDHAVQGKSFQRASLDVSAWFDHAYPLLSSGISEPEGEIERILNFSGKIMDDPYSSHDGYDWARKAGVTLGTPVHASAAGVATFKKYGACGNMIMIDHENGFQTRYCHLDDEGLITTEEPISVTNGQVIGKVGMTGRTTGPHIHFMVVQDKNNDGNFEDNIPDGILDPFGWQSTENDPWEKFTFSYANAERTGNRSQYLWNTSPQKRTLTLSSQGARVTVGGTRIDIPQYFVSADTVLEIMELPPVPEPTFDQVAEGVWTSATNRIHVVIHDGFGNVLKNFSQYLTLSLSFAPNDIARFDPNSLSLFSSPDGVSWRKETSIIDLQTNTATTQVNHLTQFALIGNPLDAIAPVTEAVLTGTLIGGEQYQGEATLTLNPSDTPLETSLGIEHTLYRINAGEMQVYGEPVAFLTPGTFTVEYYSTDGDGNSEEMKSVSFTVIPQPTPTPTMTPTPTPTSVPTNTPTPTHAPTSRPTPTPSHKPKKEVLGIHIKKAIQRWFHTKPPKPTLGSILQKVISEWWRNI